VRRSGAICTALSALSLAVPATSAAAEPRGFELGNCQGISAFISVPEENVRALVPEEFAFEKNEHFEAELLVNGSRCETLDGLERPTNLAEFRVVVADPGFTEARDGGHYQFWLVSDNPDLVKRFRDGGAAAFHVKDVAFEFDPISGKATLDAPAPTPSPFRLEADVSALSTPFPLTLTLWSTVPRGVLKIDESIPGFQASPAEGQVMPDEGSEMERVFCDDTDGTFAFADVARGLLFRFDKATFSPQLLVRQETSDTGPARCPGDAGNDA
jgi:hypothetical protein